MSDYLNLHVTGTQDTRYQVKINLDLSVCLETTECMINRTVAENVRLPKPTCNWNTGYKIPGKNKP